MENINLPSIATIQETENHGSFSIEPLFPGYGSTLGNALRRVLLSSMEGAAVDYIQIEGVAHEFSSIPGVKEDVIEILLNLKQLRFKMHTDRVEITLDVKGSKIVTAGDISASSDCEVINKDQVIATLDKDAHLQMRIGVKTGRGYEPVEKKEDRSKSVGVITTDSIYSPILAVSYNIENMRVGQMTNYDKLLIDIKTDGSMMPSTALTLSAKILTDQYSAIAGIDLTAVEEVEVTSNIVPEEGGEEIIITDDESFMILHKLDPKTKIEDAGLSGRTAHALVAAGYKTLSGLKRLSDVKLQSIKGLGDKGFDEVKSVLSRVE